MKAHRQLSRMHIIQKGPAAIALMIASEFGRAANRSEHRDNVLNCYRRARELMGVLETVALPLPVGRQLKPLYDRAAERHLLLEKHLTPDFVSKACAEFADAFNRAAASLS